MVTVERIIFVKVVSTSRNLDFIGEFVVHAYESEEHQDGAKQTTYIGKRIIHFSKRSGNRQADG